MSLKDTSSLLIFNCFDAFWLSYLQEHSNRRGRLLHVIGVFLALAALHPNAR